MGFIFQIPLETDLENTNIFYAFCAALRILMLTVMLALILLQQEERYLNHKRSCELIKFF